MRIAVLHSGDLEEVSLGGVDRYIKSLIRFFDNYEITVYGTTVVGKEELGKPIEREYYGKKYTFVAISDNKRYPLSLFYMIKECKWVNELGKYDCIYAQRTEYSIPFLFSKNKNKLIEIIHGSSKYSEAGFGKKLAYIHLKMEKLAISIARYTFVILNREEFGVPYYKNKYPKYKDRILYGKNPIDTRIYFKQNREELREKYSFDKNDIIVIYSGRIENNPKRVMLLPYICEKLLDRGIQIKFLIVGDGADKKKLEAEVDKLKLQSNFAFTGYVDNPYVIAEYNNLADIAINISMFEGTCTSVLESIACGIPVVSTDVGDIHECIFDNFNGYIIKNNECTIVDEATCAIVRIIQKSIKMNNIFEKYSGEYVIKELKQFIGKL